MGPEKKNKFYAYLTTVARLASAVRLGSRVKEDEVDIGEHPWDELAIASDANSVCLSMDFCSFQIQFSAVSSPERSRLLARESFPNQMVNERLAKDFIFEYTNLVMGAIKQQLSHDHFYSCAGGFKESVPVKETLPLAKSMSTEPDKPFVLEKRNLSAFRSDFWLLSTPIASLTCWLKINVINWDLIEEVRIPEKDEIHDVPNSNEEVRDKFELL